MKRYQSHKVVEAGRLGSFNVENNQITVIVDDVESVIIDVDTDTFNRIRDAYWAHNSAESDPRDFGYIVRYKDGYLSWSPTAAFEEGYRPAAQDFAWAKSVLDRGGMVLRSGWNGKNMFVFKQVPATIPADVIPKMTSLPQSVKDEFGRRGGSISYSNQYAIVTADNRIQGWVPSVADINACDWWEYGHNSVMQALPSDSVIEAIARMCHETNKAWCEANGDHSQKHWEDAEPWQRQSAVEGVRFRLLNPNVPASAQHDKWMKDKVDQGWVYGDVKDAEAKTHPCLVPYDQLPDADKRKDALFQAVVDALK